MKHDTPRFPDGRSNPVLLSFLFLVLLFLMLLFAPLPGSPLENRNIFTFDLDHYSEGSLRWEGQDTHLLTLNPTLTLLLRSGYLHYNQQRRTSLAAGPVIVFAPGIYGELVYTGRIESEKTLHGLSCQVTWEDPAFTASLGAEGEWNSRAENQYVTLSSLYQHNLTPVFRPKIKYFFTRSADTAIDHSLWLSLPWRLDQTTLTAGGTFTAALPADGGAEQTGSLLGGLQYHLTETFAVQYQFEFSMLRGDRLGYSHTLTSDIRF